MEVLPVEGLPEVTPTDELPGLITDHITLEDDDIVCIASTIVSKSEGRTAELDSFPPGPRATEIANQLSVLTGEEKDPRFAQAVLAESTDVLIEAPFLLTETTTGHIGVNAGIDRSNVPDDDTILLLPEDPVDSAKRINEALSDAAGVVITDTCGRPFRYGQQGVAIAWDGIPANRDWRGEHDRHGYELEVTVQCVVDELAGTANLVMGEGDDGTPVVVIRDWSFGDHAGDNSIFRSVADDYIRQALRTWTYQPSS